MTRGSRTWLSMLVLAAACGGRPGSPGGATPATPTPGRMPPGPPPPAAGLPVPSLHARWAPPMVVAGDLDRLRTVLEQDQRIAVVSGSRFAGKRGTAQVESWVHGLAPHARIVRTETASLRDVLEAPTPLPVQREGSSEGRPRYAAAGTHVREGVLPPADEADVVLLVDDADLDLARWQAMPARSVGTCAPAIERMALAQEQSLAQLEPFLDHADALAAGVYRTLLPEAVSRVAGTLGSGAPDDDLAACIDAYRDYLRPFESCVADGDACSMAPRLFLLGGLRFASAEPPELATEGCVDRLGQDPVAELRDVARETARITAEGLDPAWVARADRAASLTEIHAALEDACWPRRRRFAPEDVDEARNRLERVGGYLASAEPAREGAHWVVADDSFHVAGLGAVRQLVRHDPGEGSPGARAVAEGRALREFLLDRAQCSGGHDTLPRAVVAVNVASGELTFFGYFYDEELSCGELGPLLAASRETTNR